MARTTSGGPLWLLFVLAALCNHLAAADSVLTASSNKNIAFAGNRKLLQGSGSSGSTVFGDPPAGTLVVTWNPIPAKHSDNPDYGEITAAPYQYDWFNIYPISSSCANCSTLYFYPAAAYVAGPGGQKTQLTVSSGGCDLTTREYADLGQLTNSCQGSFAVPDNKTVAVSQVWDLLQAPDNLEFQVPTPLASLDCIAFFFGPSGPSMSGEALTNFQAAFDTGPIPIKPAGTDNTLPTGIFSNIGFESLPISGPGTLTFKSINMRLTYDPPVPIKGFDWSFLYAHCAFSSDQLTVRSVVPPPVGEPVGGTCDPRSSTPNQCFNAAGNYYVCCTTHCPANPGPTPTCSVLDPVPEAHPVGGTCDPKSNEPNQCFNSDGSYYVCCPGQCAGNPSLRPACA